MKPEHINPFIESVHELFATMLGAKVVRGKVAPATDTLDSRSITAVIGLSGAARGAVVLSLPARTAVTMVNQLLGSDSETLDETITDGVSELANMVAGAAKAKFAGDDASIIELSLPTVVKGENYSIEYPSEAIWLEVPFTSDLGPFSLRVCFEKVSEQSEDGQ